MNSPEVEVGDESVENCEKGVAAKMQARKGTCMKGRERYSLQQECTNRISSGLCCEEGGTTRRA
jgi:hypothetical protein